MGSTYIQGFIDEGVSLEKCLAIHLQSNHYPPVSVDFVPVCRLAIKYAIDGQWGIKIPMPNGKTLSVSEIVEGLHLDCFLIEDDEYNDED